MPDGEDQTIETTPEETPESDTTVAPEETPEEQPKFAGKYANEEDALRGVNEARKKLGLGDVEKLYGEGGLYADRAAAERGYKELSTLLRTAKPDAGEPAEMTLGEEADDAAPGEPVTPEQILEKAGLKLTELEAAYTESGRLTDEQYKAIQKVRPGLSRELIDTLADGMRAKAQVVRAEQSRMRAEAADLVGGDDALSEMLKNARSFVPADEFDDLQQRIRDPKRFKGAVRDLKEFHANAVGAGKAKPLAGGGAPAGEAGAKDAAEFSRLMRAAAAGDESASRKIRATPNSKVSQWLSQATG